MSLFLPWFWVFAIIWVAVSQIGRAQGLRASLAYLRDRVGVPRDMSLPAARWTRATLNSVIDEV